MDDQQKLLLEKYVQAVLAAPPHLHLTADRDPELFWNRHIMDAVAILDAVPPFYRKEAARLVDVGSGNGIPGIPISVLMPHWTVDMIDSDNKKCGFIDAFISSNAINNGHVFPGRAEVLAHTKMRNVYDIVIARALSKMRTTIELAAAFVKKGGILIVPHGTSWQAELGTNADALDLLGLDMPSPMNYSLAGQRFTAVIFSKISDTPPKFPRKNGLPSKRPL